MKSFAPTTSQPVQLSSKEYTVLRAHLMGLSEIALTQLLRCSNQTLSALWFGLTRKFKVENSYMVVKKALQMGLISEENYQPEFTKEATLAFLDEFGIPQLSNEKSIHTKWEAYQYLLKYQSYLNQFEPQKKSYRSGIKDFLGLRHLALL